MGSGGDFIMDEPKEKKKNILIIIGCRIIKPGVCVCVCVYCIRM